MKPKNFGVAVAVLVEVAIIVWSLGAAVPVFAFSVLGTFTGGGSKFAVIFDGAVSSTTATPQNFTLSAGTVSSTFTSFDSAPVVIGIASGTVAVGSTVTVSSSVMSATNATNTTTAAQTLLPAVKIAAVRAGGTSNNLDEYVMLYNGGDTDWVASGTLHLHVMRAPNDIDVPLTFATSSIPSNGFFLIASQNGYSGGIAPDAMYSTSTDLMTPTSTAVYINTSSTSRASIIDKVEWGGAAQVATSSNSSSSFIVSVATTTLSNGVVLVRKAQSSSTASSMMSGGADSNKGNASDIRDNSQNFVLLDPSAGQTALIKNSQSPKEFPYGGGIADTSAPTVFGSFPGSASDSVPTDLPFIGFGFSKPVNPTTVSTSTVSLVVQGQSANLCANVTYTNIMMINGPPGQCVVGGGLTAGTTYVFTIKGASSSPSVADFAGNALNQPAGSGQGQHGTATHDYQITFSPQIGFVQAPQMPPFVLGSFPMPGTSGIATNITKISASFSQAMASSSFGGVTLTAAGGGANLLNNASTTFSSDGLSATFLFTSTLTAGSSYTLTIPSTVRNSNNIPLPLAYSATFTAGSGPYVTGPQVLGHLPNIASGVPVSAVDVHASTDQNLDPSTISTTTVQVTDPVSNVLPGAVSYDPLAKEIVWVGSNVFQTNTTYAVSYNASGSGSPITNVAGLALQTSTVSKYQFSFTTSGTADTTAPGILFANANNFSVAITFDKIVKNAEAQTIANYTITSGGSPVTLSAFSGNTATYNAAKKTVIINNLNLTTGALFAITASNIHDLSGNLLDPTKNSFGGTVQAPTINGGNIGVGQGYISSTSTIPVGFAGGSFSFVPQPGVRPVNSLAGFTSGYNVNLPISKQIPAGGKIILTFPSSFTLAGAAADSFSPANNDINGPGVGVVTMASVVGNDTAHTVTVTLSGTPTQNVIGDVHDFLHFDLMGIGNSPVPNSASGYTVDIRTLNGTSSLESLTSMPFFITAGGTANLTVSVAASGATAGTANVYLFSPATGPLSTSTTAFSSGNATATFAGVPNGTYNIATDPIVSLTGGTFVGLSSPLPVSVNATTTTSITFSAASSLASSTVNIHATGVKKVSAFAGGPNGYVDTPVTTSNGTTTAVIYYSANGLYNVGVGPQINKTFMGPPPSPDYVMPKPVQVNVASGVASQTTINFDLLSAGQTISGSVQDGAGKSIANANVYAYSPQGGFGTFAQSGSNGSFSLNVAPGSYKLGANAPGFPSAQDIAVIVDASGNMFLNGSIASSTSTIIKLTNSGVTITGSVTDGTNPVQGGQIWAYCDPSVSGNACFGPSGNANAQTDSSGVYTLYVGNGTWKVGAFIPGYGRQPEISVVISGSSVSGKNFQPSATGTFKSVSGTVCTNTTTNCTGGTAISGARVSLYGTDPIGNYYSNTTISTASGTYSFASVPAGSGSSYTLRGFSPTLGELPATASFTVTSTNVTAQDLAVNAGRTINVNVNGSPASFSAFMKFVNTTNGAGNFLNFQNNTSGTIQVSNGSIYAVDARAPGFSFSASSLSLATGTATYSTSTGQLDLTSGSNTVVLNLTFPTSTVLSGTVKDGSGNLVGNAWVDINNPSLGLDFGSQANASGTYSIAVPDGSYSVAAYSPGYLPNSKFLSLANGTTTLGTATTTASAANLTLTKTSLSVSGTVTVNGNPAVGALVKGVLKGGGSSVVVANNSGAFSLPVSTGSWTISAAAGGFQNANYSGNPVVVASASVTGVTINLTITANLGTPTSQPITPSQGGLVRNTSGTVQVSIPANALGSSANSGQIQVAQTSGIIQTATAKPVGSVGQDIKAYDSSNNAINTLNDNVTISLDVASSSFSGSSITSTSTAQKLQLGYMDASLGDWATIPTTITYESAAGMAVTPTANLSNVDHITLSGPTNHFTVFGPIIRTTSLAPSVPTGVGATVSGSSIRITWTAPTTNSDGSTLTDLQEFEIYRDTSATGSFGTQVNTSQVASGTLTFTDATVVAGTTYYYEVTAANTSGNESTKSSTTGGVAVPSASSSGGGGGGGGGTAILLGCLDPTSPLYNPSANFNVPSLCSASSTSPSTAIPTSTVATTSTTLALQAQLNALMATLQSLIARARQGGIALPPGAQQFAKSTVAFARSLTMGAKGDDVISLQRFLIDRNSGPAALKLAASGASGYFGRLTKKALIEFQKSVGITPASGYFGPKTRAYINSQSR